jgi:cytochrome c oxidase subunit 4
MSHAPYTPEEYKKNVSKIWKTTGILSFVTFLEVGVAVLVEMPYSMLAAFVSIVSIIKAFYIMNIFMHVGHETKGFKFVILFPFIFLIWGFVAFSLEGLSYAGMRDALNIVLKHWSF